MTIVKSFAGHCPTQNHDEVIDVIYRHVSGKRYLQTGADCPYASYANHSCPIMKDCPVRSLAPNEIFE